MGAKGALGTLVLRSATEADQPFLRRLFESTRQSTLGSMPVGEEIRADLLRRQFAAQRDAYAAQWPDAHHWIVELGDEAVGQLYLAQRGDELRLIDIALMPRYRNRGIGERLIRDLQAAATRASTPIRLHVEHGSPAMRLYRRLGFVMLEDREVNAYMEWRP